jgi:cytochrome c oxidase subunit IV
MSESHEAKHVHITSPGLLLAVFAGLVICTALTVGISYVDLGAMNIWIALGIAVIKGGLVAMFFMHLCWDSPFNGLVLVISLMIVATFIGLAILDSGQYRHTYEQPGSGRVLNLGYGQ